MIYISDNQTFTPPVFGNSNFGQVIVCTIGKRLMKATRAICLCRLLCVCNNTFSGKYLYKTYSVLALTDSNAGGGRFLTKGIHKNSLI